MKCANCGRNSKEEYCPDCIEDLAANGIMISRNKVVLKDLKDIQKYWNK